MIAEYKSRIKRYLDKIDGAEILVAVNSIRLAIKENKNIFIIGNGGSMATAMHFAEDLMLQTKYPVKVSVLSSAPAITAIGNDYSFDKVFEQQLENLMNPGDLLISLSCSGKSQDLVDAIHYANTKGTTLSITGFKDNKMMQHSNFNIHVETTPLDYYATEDIHSIICHIIVAKLRDMM